MSSAERFISRLRKLGAADRQALKASATRPAAPDVAAHDAFTAAFWPIRNANLPRDPCRLVASLYFWNAKEGMRGNLIDSLLAAVNRRKLDREPTEQLVTALLAAPFARLPALLLIAVQRLNGVRIAVEWRRLLDDLSRWDRPSEDKFSVQETWANSWLSTGDDDAR